ncbi:hypothetical protein UFOVP134_3 [uncultured Caudovirales phage]|uniref:Uncharacterized protein n=1 Tax=uncultured Caudovirales phage TaxID=2100421 RepID=A0A6J5LBY3_9CAUD|nr:hypothetical protein UFOVP134_3 [uncultured Caudovirales phage]
MSLAVVQSVSAASASNPSTPEATFGSAPTNGNMLVAAYFIPTSVISLNTAAGWRLLGVFYEPDVPSYMVVAYRYAGAGESTTQEPDTSSSADGWALTMWEISGVTGDAGQDLADVYLSRPTDYPGTSASPTSWNTSFGNELVLLGSENGTTSDLTISVSGGTWTTDSGPEYGNQQGYNQVAYGFHSSITSGGTAVAPTLSATAGSRFYVGFVGLSSSVPTTGPTVVQSAINGSPGSGSAAPSVTMPKAPANGNLLVAYAYFRQLDGAPTANTGWTLDADVSILSSGYYVATYYKYAGGSESTTQTPDSVSRENWDCVVWEVTNVSGSWTNDHVSTGSQYGVNASTETPTGITTSNANELVLHGSSYANGSGLGSLTHLAGVPTSAYLGGGSGYNHYVEARHYVVPTSGTTVGDTAITAQSASGTPDLIGAFVELKKGASASTETGNVSMTLHGVNFAAEEDDHKLGGTLTISKVSFAVDETIKETGSGTLTIGRVTMSAAESFKETGSGTITLGGVTIVAQAIDLNALSPVRQFSTFG